MGFSCFTFVLVSFLGTTLLAQVNAVPTINGPVNPQAVVPGSIGFTLTVRGAGFVPGAVVNWNGTARSTTFVSAGELQAQILASDVALAGSALITATNPPARWRGVQLELWEGRDSPADLDYPPCPPTPLQQRTQSR